MGVRIRLSRVGRPKMAVYRIVAADSRRGRSSRYLEVVGTYDPKKSDVKVTWKAERVRHWLSKGALPTDTVAQLLRQTPLAS